MSSHPTSPSRRRFLAAAGAPVWVPLLSGTPPVVAAPGSRPETPFGVQSGDVAEGRAVVWSRTDRPARMWVEWDVTDRFTDARRVAGPSALETTDFTARAVLTDLPAGQRIFYRVRFQDLADLRAESEPAAGSFRTLSREPRAVRFVWGGDVVGQGWGIDPDRGGMLTFESMRRAEPDFFIHSGDAIYADNPLQPEVRLPDGTVWRNRMTEAKSKVAETLDEFRGCYRYNLTDEHLRRFNAAVPVLAQWDDHETCNNWYPGRRMDADARYTVKSCDLLAARAKRAFLDYMPLRLHPDDPERIYRAYSCGPLVEVLMLDERSYRGPNPAAARATADADTAFLGSAQLRWLRERLSASTAVWKIIASDMPLGLVVGDGPGSFEAVANGDGPARGRELEIAGLLRYLQQRRVRNVVWLTADVHYAAAHHYSPTRARFTEFHPFWEFIAGPLHAGNFGPGRLDNTFGPEVRFSTAPPGTPANRPPSEGRQFFGQVRVDPRSTAMTVSLHDRQGRQVYAVELPPER